MAALVHRPHPRSWQRPAAALLLALAWRSALAPAPAQAAETQWWITDQPADYAKAELHGIVVRADGALEPGPAARSVAAESLSVVWSLAVLADGSVALAGDHGRILRWTAAGGIKPWVRLPGGQVLALARSGDGLMAGTGPDGAVYRIGPRGDTTLVVRTGERYVWGLAPGPGGAWYAATGTRGRLLRIENGKARVVVDTDESNLVSILPDGRGGVFAGGDSKGRVIHARADGTVGTVFDATEDEVRALALGPDGALYAACLSASAVIDDDHAVEGPSPAKNSVTGGRAVVYRIVPDSASAAWWTSPQPFVFALAAGPRGVVAATGNRAALYLLERANGAAQWMAPPQGQITALAVGPDGTVYAATSNAASLWRVGPGTAARGELISPVFDGHRLARFGRALVRGERKGSSVELLAHSGNSDPPDTTWSPWVGGAVHEGGLKLSSPPARYLQWKLVLAGGSPRLESVETSWREPNVAPRIEDLVVAPQGQGFQAGEAQPRVEPVTQILPGGQKVEYSLPGVQSARQLRDLPMFARGMRTITWRASDANGDLLHYRVDVRRESSEDWVKLASDQEASAFTWDTNALPDGRYRVRVIASDEASNPLGEELGAEASSAPFTVDNTSPVVSVLEARVTGRAITVQGRAEDGQSTLARIEVSVDDGQWRPITPDGGFADQGALSFRGTLPEVEPGEHLVAARAVDAAGNAAVRSTHVSVARGR
jgi:hypothetical protein